MSKGFVSRYIFRNFKEGKKLSAEVHESRREISGFVKEWFTPQNFRIQKYSDTKLSQFRVQNLGRRDQTGTFLFRFVHLCVNGKIESVQNVPDSSRIQKKSLM